ncbi:MAG: quinone oxidoreductase [Proteobacteria bacterium]|nr:quinone oxidoreductase [Pseudomonadota bacterium]
MVKAIRQYEFGGPEVLKWEDVEVGTPGPGEARVRHTAVGLNYIDVYFRTGLYPAELPISTGMEAAGVIEELGDGVSGLKVGDRVAYAGRPVGAYTEARVMPADGLIKLPDSIDDETAAAMMLQGMTTEYLLQRTYPLKKGDTFLFHAAAGGVGLFVCQWARHIGATMIGTVGSDEKAELAKSLGCTHTINYRDGNFADKVRELTDGKGVPVVYDAIGKDTFMESLDCLQPRGLMVSFGNATGPVSDLNLGVLAAKGSLYLTRPTLMTYNEKREDLEKSAGDLMRLVGDGTIKVTINQRYALSDARQAHEDLESRKTTGSTVFTV